MQEKLKRFGLFEISNVFLPTKTERFTVLRSPHVDKKARDQFERKTHKRLLILKFLMPSNESLYFLQRALELLKNIALGVEISVKYKVNKA